MVSPLWENSKYNLGTCLWKKYMHTNSNMQQGKTCTLQLPVHYIYMYIDVVACAGPEVHVLHTNRFELHTCTYTSGFGQYQASSAALATERERERERGSRLTDRLKNRRSINYGYSISICESVITFYSIEPVPILVHCGGGCMWSQLLFRHQLWIYFDIQLMHPYPHPQTSSLRLNFPWDSV